MSTLTKSQLNFLSALESLFPEQKNFGGNLLKLGSSFIPGLQMLPAAIDLLSGGLDFQTKQNFTPVKMNTNPFGNLEKGGWIQKAVNPEHKGYCTPMTKATCTPRRKAFAMTMKKHHGFHKEDGGEIINNDFKQYSAGSHNSGQDLAVDINGNASNSPVATVQNKENMFRVGGKPYIMSDVLVNPETGNTFNVDASKVNKEFPNASQYPEDKKTLNFKMERLSKLNDGMRMLKESVEEKRHGGCLACGGRLKMYENGGSFIPRRIDPITQREYNLISDAPAYDPLSEPIETIPQVNTYPDILNRVQNQKREPNLFMVNPDNSQPDDRSFVPENINTVSEPSVDDRSFLGEQSENVLSTVSKGLDLNIPAIALKGAGLFKSILDASKKPEIESPILPDYTAANKYMKEANIDFTQAKQEAVGASNIGANVNRSASGNFGQYINREMARTARLADSLGNIDMEQNNQRSQLNLRRGAFESQKAVDNANRLYQNRVDNYMNKANADYAKQKLFTELTQIGSEFNKGENFKRQLANNKELQNYYVGEALALINARNDNFKLDPGFVEKLKSGNYSLDDVVKVVNITGVQ